MHPFPCSLPTALARRCSSAPPVLSLCFHCDEIGFYNSVSVILKGFREGIEIISCRFSPIRNNRSLYYKKNRSTPLFLKCESLSSSQEVLPVFPKANRSWNSPVARLVVEERGSGLMRSMQAQEGDVLLLTAGEHPRAVRSAPRTRPGCDTGRGCPQTELNDKHPSVPRNASRKTRLFSPAAGSTGTAHTGRTRLSVGRPLRGLLAFNTRLRKSTFIFEVLQVKKSW